MVVVLSVQYMLPYSFKSDNVMTLLPQAGLQSLSVLAGNPNPNSTVSEIPPATIYVSLPGTTVWRCIYSVTHFGFVCGILV